MDLTHLSNEQMAAIFSDPNKLAGLHNAFYYYKMHGDALK